MGRENVSHWETSPLTVCCQPLSAPSNTSLMAPAAAYKMLAPSSLSLIQLSLSSAIHFPLARLQSTIHFLVNGTTIGAPPHFQFCDEKEDEKLDLLAPLWAKYDLAKK
jgi:hypothetical protein